MDLNGKRTTCTPVKLTDAQQDRLDTVLTWTVFHQPFFAHLLMAELPIVATRDVPIAATDAFCIYINPDTFFGDELKLTIQEQAFIICHEVMHCVYSDPQLMYRWNKAGNVVIGNKTLL